MKAQEFYQLYRKKTIEAGYTPIGRQRFTGIIKTLSLIPETIDYLQCKENKGLFTYTKTPYLKDIVNNLRDDVPPKIVTVTKGQSVGISMGDIHKEDYLTP